MTEVERERRIIELLSEAVALAGRERLRFLDEACAGDPGLRAELESMLAGESALAGGFLETPAVAGLSGAPADDEPLGEAPAPERLGPYRIIKKLGWGGMGTVYLGEQEEPVRRRVALKVIAAIHDRGQRKRFAAECQALARLGHPNIASLYEVGTTDDGHPFVAMEPVDGTTITTWCDERGLRLRERIELFLGVCAGVRHAHEKGILHRDLKPSNVLVTEVDGRPTAKVIDFGIARALDEPLLVDTSMTRAHDLIGSPAYMSPEAAIDSRDVDTRSDVYSLGVLLYRLLAGVLPFAGEGESVAVLLHRIVEEGAPGPSTRLAGLDRERLGEIAARRGLSGEGLRRRIRGDLDAILRKATARDRERRYSSPADLAADLEHYLASEPIAARPPTTSYVLGRFLRRRIGVVVAVALLVLALAAGVVARTREARRASQEAERAREALAEAQEVSQFLVDLFEVADPERRPGEAVDARELLDRGAERLRDELGDQPLARARFLHTIGDIYTNMALFEPAEALVSEALEIRQAELPATHPDVLESVNQLGVIYRRQHRLDEAEPLLRRVLEAREAAPEPDPVAVALALNNLGNLLWSQRRLDEAEAVHRRALEIRERERGRDHEELAETLNNLGVLLRDRQRYEEARPFLQRAAEIFAAALGPGHPKRAASLHNLALVEEALDQWQDAETHSREAIAIWHAAYGAEHPRTLMARSGLVGLLRRQGREAESLELLRDVLRIREKTLAPDAPEIAGSLTSLGITLGHLGDFEEAETTFQRALAIYRTARGEEHPSTVNARSNLAWLAWRRGRLAEAEAAHREVLGIRERIAGPEHRSTAWTLHHLALAIADQGRDAEAEPLLERALAIREAVLGEEHRDVADTLHALGEIARRDGRVDEAAGLLRRALEIRRRTLPLEHRDLRRTIDALASITGPADR